MNTGFYWRRAHAVRRPDRLNTDPHLELYEAYRRDVMNAEISEQIAAEIERDFSTVKPEAR